MRRSLLVAAVGFLAFTAGTVVVAQEERTPSRSGRMARERAEEQGARLRLHALEVQAAANAKATKPKTVRVDCGKRKTIAAALADTADTLIIEISGVCQENFQVRRSNVTFRGSDPALDGIQGVVADPQPLAAVELRYAENIRFENLKIQNSPSIGLGAWDSYVEFANCQFLDNINGAGLLMSSSSYTGAATNVTFKGNKIGLKVQRNAIFQCTGCSFENNRVYGACLPLYGNFYCDQCTFTGNRNNAVLAYGASYGGVTNSTFTDNGIGVESDVGSDVYVADSTITATPDQFAVYSSWYGIVDLWGVGVVGQIYAEESGQLFLFGVTQAPSSDFENGVMSNSLLTAGRRKQGSNWTNTTLAGIVFDGFSKGLLGNLTTVNGNITCYTGADASAGNATITGTVTDCDHLKK
jgi:hypothetical protein